MIFLLDNYDSFTYNLYQMLLMLGKKVEVGRNDRVSVGEVRALKPAAIVLSPGPGRPEDAGVMMELIGSAVEDTPMLGVCLGMQGIGMHYGAKVVSARELMHGKTCAIRHTGKGIFSGVQERPVVMRYHSLALEGLPDKELVQTAHSEDSELMAFRHRSLSIVGVQFHPESFATPDGQMMLKNFLDHAAG